MRVLVKLGVFLLLLVPSVSFAVNADDFDDYVAGSLSGTGGIWNYSGGVNNIEIKNAVSKSSPNSIGCSSSGDCGNATTTFSDSGVDVYTHIFWVYQTGNTDFEAGLGYRNGDTYASAYSISTGTLRVNTTGTTGEMPGSVPIPTNEWVKITLEVDFSGLRARAKFESTGTTSPYTSYGVISTTTRPTHMLVDAGNDGALSWYIDDWGGAQFTGSSTNAYQNKIYSITAPTDGQILTTTPTEFRFTYLVSTSSVFDTVGFEIRRASDFSLYAQQEESITSYNSSAQFSRFGNLEYGVSYVWLPYLKNSVSGGGVFGINNSGRYYSFSLVDEETYANLVRQSLNSTTTGSTTIVSDVGINFSTSTMFGGFHSVLAGKWPFAYMIDFVEAWFVFRDAVYSPHNNLSYHWDVASTTGDIMLLDLNSTTSSSSLAVMMTAPIRYWSSLMLYFTFAVWSFGLASRLL